MGNEEVRKMVPKHLSKALIFCTAYFLAFLLNSMGSAVNWNSIEVNDVEYYVQTDKSVYDLGENVEMLYRITNQGDEDISFSFPHTPEWNFWIEKNGVNTWTAVKSWYEVVSEFTLVPGEYIEFPHFSSPLIWDMMDNNGVQVQLGQYDVIGGLDLESYYDYTKISVPIEIVPEPNSIMLLAIGTVFIRRRTAKNCRGI